jgi:hypothetical protein
MLTGTTGMTLSALGINNFLSPQAIGQNQTKADRFSNAFSEHIRRLGASQNDNALYFSALVGNVNLQTQRREN